jgi:hypothetical protein
LDMCGLLWLTTDSHVCAADALIWIKLWWRHRVSAGK